MYHPLKYDKIEAERGFLLKSIPEDLNAEESYLRIIDRYITGTRLRIRRIESPLGETLIFKLGQKYQTTDQDAYQSIMTNIYLNEGEYSALATLGASTLIKRRYTYNHAGDDYSIDVHEGHLIGLILAEIESHSNIDITLLPVPDFTVKEVTDDPRFTGGELVKLSKEEFQQWLLTW
jgi:CYTH domain-containing protein